MVNYVDKDEIVRRINIAVEHSNKKITYIDREAGLSIGSVSNYCSGRYIPKAKNAIALSRVLGVSTEWLLGLE